MIIKLLIHLSTVNRGGYIIKAEFKTFLTQNLNHDQIFDAQQWLDLLQDFDKDREFVEPLLMEQWAEVLDDINLLTAEQILRYNAPLYSSYTLNLIKHQTRNHQHLVYQQTDVVNQHPHPLTQPQVLNIILAYESAQLKLTTP